MALAALAAVTLVLPQAAGARHQLPVVGQSSYAYGFSPSQFDAQAPDGRRPGLADWELAELARNHMSYLRGNLGFEDVYPRDVYGFGSVGSDGVVDTADPNRLRPDWGRSDQVMCRLSRHGLSWLPVLTLRGPVAGKLGAVAPDDPTERLYFRRFATQVARRYRRGGEFWRDTENVCARQGIGGPFRSTPISAWEIWNEPNAIPFWRTPEAGGPNPGEYKLLLQAAREGIKRYADPSARVLFGGLAANGTARSFYRAATSVDEFARTCLSDAVGLHPYDADAATVAANVQAMRHSMNGLAHGDRPLWVSEWGWTTGNPEDRYYARPDAAEQSQAMQVGSFLEWVTRNRGALNLGPLQYFGLRDEPGLYSGGNRAYAFMGLVAPGLNPDGSFVRAKPGFQAYAVYTNAAPLIPLPALRCPERWS